MNGQNAFDGLEFDEQLVLHNTIDAIAAVEIDACVCNWQRRLPDRFQAVENELTRKTICISRFQQTRAKRPVDLDRATDHFLREGMSLGFHGTVVGQTTGQRDPGPFQSNLS